MTKEEALFQLKMMIEFNENVMAQETKSHKHMKLFVKIAIGFMCFSYVLNVYLLNQFTALAMLGFMIFNKHNLNSLEESYQSLMQHYRKISEDMLDTYNQIQEADNE